MERIATAIADYVTIYGLRPADWFAKGVRLLGRTAVECTRDELANAVGKEIAAIAASGAEAAHVVLDPFAGVRQHAVLDLAPPAWCARYRFRARS
jgi:hypothetical protein